MQVCLKVCQGGCCGAWEDVGMPEGMPKKTHGCLKECLGGYRDALKDMGMPEGVPS